MASLRKTLLTLGSLLGASQLFTIRSSVYFAFLVGFQRRRSIESPGNRPQYWAFLTFKALLYLAIGGYSQSWLLGAYLKLSGHSLLGHLTVDSLFALITAKYSAANVFFLTGLGLMGVSIFYVDYGLSLGLDTALTSLLYQVICENPKDFFKLNGHLSKIPPIKYLLLHPVKGLVKIRLLAAQLWNPSLNFAFASARLEAFPYLSMRTRSRLVLLTFIYEHALAGAALALVVLFALFVAILMSLLCNGLSPYLAIGVFADSLLLALIYWHTFVFIYFALHGFLLITFLTCSHLKEMNNHLAILLSQLKKYRVSNGSHLLSRQLSVFFTQHHSLSIIQVTFNEQMVSPFFCVAFFSALLFQVVQLNILLLKELQLEEKCVCLLFSLTETVVALQTIRLLTSWTDSLTNSASLLFQAQGIFLRSENRFKYPATVASKLKLMTYIERLCTIKKVSFTVGPIGSISSRALYEFFFAYSAFFLYMASLMRKLR